MPPLAPTRGKPGAAGGSLSRKVGGLPVWAWALAGVAAVGLGLYLRKRLAAGTGSTTVASPAADTTGAGGASGAGTGDTSSLDANTAAQQDLASALNGLTYLLGSGVAPVAASSDAAVAPSQAAAAPVASATTSPYVNSLNPGSIYVGPGGQTYALQPGGFEPAYVGPSGGYVSPGTYQGLQETPQPITAGLVQQLDYTPASIPVPPVRYSSVVLPQPAPSTPKLASNAAIAAGQKAVNERPTVVKGRGRAL